MGIAFENGTVHECTRVALVGITTDVLHISVGNDISCQLPLHTSGEAAASTSTQTGVEDSLDNVLRLHLCKYLAQSLVTVSAYVLVYILRVDNAAVSQSNTVLLLIESGIIESLDCIAFNSLLVEELLNGVALKQMLLNDAGDLLNVNTGVE